MNDFFKNQIGIRYVIGAIIGVSIFTVTIIGYFEIRYVPQNALAFESKRIDHNTLMATKNAVDIIDLKILIARQQIISENLEKIADRLERTCTAKFNLDKGE